MKQILSVLFLFLVISCSKQNLEINKPPVSEIQFVDAFDKIVLNGSHSSDPEGRPLTYHWTTSSSRITILGADTPNAAFNIPSGSGEEVDIMLTVSDGKLENNSVQTISVPALTKVREYGLGKNLDKEVSNEVSYEWYLDQGMTGEYSDINCGPTAVTMAILWSNKDFTKTPQDARNTLHSSGGLWYTGDITYYLQKYNVNTWVDALTDINVAKNEIDKGNILVLCVCMEGIPFNPSLVHHRDRFYERVCGHFIVVKGYKIVDGTLFFEVYDPYSMGNRYASDRVLKGKNRYYKDADVDNVTQSYWDYAIVISNKITPGGRKGVDTNKIPNVPGG